MRGRFVPRSSGLASAAGGSTGGNAPVVRSPPVDQFDACLVNHDHVDPNTFMLVGSFHVVLTKGKDGWTVSIASILDP